MYEHVKTGCKQIPPNEQPLQFQSGYFLNKPRISTLLQHHKNVVDKFVLPSAVGVMRMNPEDMVFCSEDDFSTCDSTFSSVSVCARPFVDKMTVCCTVPWES